MTIPRTLSLFATLIVSVNAFAADPTGFLPADAIAVEKLLSEPAVPGSVENQRELEMVLALQPTRTPEDIARIRREGRLSPFLFDDVVGAWFTPANLPLTTALLERAGKDAMHLGENAKKLWARPRPPAQDARIKNSVGLPSNGSYPSSHAACGLLWGTLLAELAPDLRHVLLKRGELIGDGRVIGGVHFPSDVEAGRVLARAVLAKLEATAEFKASLASAREEFRRVRAKHHPAGS